MSQTTYTPNIDPLSFGVDEGPYSAGAGSPEGAVVGFPGYVRTNTTNGDFYTKKTGSGTTTGWLLVGISGGGGSPDWANITSKPTTLAGYGITNAVIKNGDLNSGQLVNGYLYTTNLIGSTLDYDPAAANIGIQVYSNYGGSSQHLNVYTSGVQIGVIWENPLDGVGGNYRPTNQPNPYLIHARLLSDNRTGDDAATLGYLIGIFGAGGVFTLGNIGNVVIGINTNSGVLTAATQGDFASGLADGADSEIEANGGGNHAYGAAFAGGLIYAGGGPTHLGNAAWGYATGTASQIKAETLGATAWGFVTGGSTIIADSSYDSSEGANAYGYATATGKILASGRGANAYGYVSDADSLIESKGLASVAWGTIFGGGLISSTGNGTLAFGNANSTGQIKAYAGNGSFAFGYTSDGGIIEAHNNGSFGFGNSAGADSLISAPNDGSTAWGWANSGGSIISESGSVAFGYVSAANSKVDLSGGTGSMGFGIIEAGGQLIVSGGGSLALGLASDNAANVISCAGNGSLVTGVASDGATHGAGGNASVIGGENVSSSGHHVFLWGKGYANNSNNIWGCGNGDTGHSVIFDQTTGRLTNTGPLVLQPAVNCGTTDFIAAYFGSDPDGHFDSLPARLRYDFTNEYWGFDSGVDGNWMNFTARSIAATGYWVGSDLGSLTSGATEDVVIIGTTLHFVGGIYTGHS